MIGKNNSIASRFLERNENVFIAGFPFHLAHIATSNSQDNAFGEFIGLNVEDVMVDLFYWFDKSIERKGNFAVRSIKEFESTCLSDGCL